MSNSLIRYYYYLEDDADKLTYFKEDLNSRNFVVNHGLPVDMLSKNTPPEMFFELKHANLGILVVCYSADNLNWLSALKDLQSWEEKANLPIDDLIGRTSVLVSLNADWDEMLATAQAAAKSKEAILIDLEHGQLARLGHLWRRGQAYYACNLQELSRYNQEVLGQGLPLLESGLLRLRMISGLLRDQKNTINKEKEELDYRLSNILHTHLVSEKGCLEEARELEKQIEELSTAYGIIAGDYNTVLTASSRVASLLDSLVRQFKTTRGIHIGADLLDEILQPYRIRLGELQETSNNLKISRENFLAAIEVVQGKIDIMNARSNIATQEDIRTLMQANVAIQKQSLVFQYAAGLIEFIVLAYYSHSLWKNLAYQAYHTIPNWIQFLVVIAFSGTTVYCTHLLAEYMQGDKHVKQKLILAAVPLILLVLAILITSAHFSGGPAH